jgi:hypothetical protein
MVSVLRLRLIGSVLKSWFYVDAGKIRTIYAAVLHPPPEAMIPNWPPFDGNWPAK